MNRNSLSVPILSLLFLWMMIGGKLPVSGQSPNNLLFNGEFGRTDEYKWSSDSNLLTFYNYDLGSTSTPLTVITEASGWQTIDMSTNSLLSGTNVWPLQPVFTEEQISLFMPHEFIYTSPDSNLVIFGQEPADNLILRKLVIANRTTLQVVSLGIRVASDTFRPNSFNVQWSEDNHAATVGFFDLSDSQQIIHIDIPNFDDLREVIVRKFSVEINGKPYTTTPAYDDKLLDLSTDGQAVLIIARDSTVTELTTFYDNPPQLVIWHPYSNDAEIVGADILIDGDTSGSFAQNSSSILFFTTSQGLLVHDSTTDTTRQLLGSERVINSYEYFSPDGQWLAIAKFDSFEILSLHDLMIQIFLTESDSATTVTESGATDTYTLALGTQPTADVVVSVTGNAQISVSPVTLTFTAENWDVSQTVTVSAVDDSVVEGDHTAVITHSAVSADAGYNGISVADVTVTITDNDNDTLCATMCETTSPNKFSKEMIGEE